MEVQSINVPKLENRKEKAALIVERLLVAQSCVIALCALLVACLCNSYISGSDRK